MAEYTTLNHPILGKVDIRTDKLDQMTPAELNNMLVQRAVDQLEKDGVELSAFDAFTGQFAREITSTSRGIQEALSEGERTTDYESDFMTEVALKASPKAAWSGLIAGAILDPITFLNPWAKATKVAAIAGGAGTGALAGFFTPVREDFGESAAITTGVGAGIGAAIPVLGPAAGKIAAKLGTTVEGLRDKFSKATPEEKKELQKEIEQIVEEEIGSDFGQGMPPSAGQVDEFVPDMADPLARAEELANIRRVGDEAEAARKAEQDAELERIRNIGKEAELERIKKVGEDFDPDTDIKKQIADMEEEVAALPSSAKQARFVKDQAEIKSQIGQLEKSIENLRKAYNKTSTAKKSPDKKTKMSDIEARLNKAQARLTQRQGELRFVEAQPQRFKELKAARKEIDQYKKDGTVPSFVKINKPATKTDVNVDEALAAKASQLGYKSPEPQQYVPQQAIPERPVQSLPEAPAAMDMYVPELGPKSVGSMAVGIKPSVRSMQRVADLDLRTKEGRTLEGTPAGAAGKEPVGSKEAKQREMLQKIDEPWSHYWQVDGISGKITLEKVGREAEELKDYVNEEITDGNYRNAADWLVKTFEKNKGMFTPAEIRIADEIWRIADNNMKAGLEAMKRLEANDGDMDEKIIAIMNGMQVDDAYKAMAKVVQDMRTIQRTEEGAKSAWSAVGRELKRVKRLSEEQYKEYKKNRVITSLMFGVKCK